VSAGGGTAGAIGTFNAAHAAANTGGGGGGAFGSSGNGDGGNGGSGIVYVRYEVIPEPSALALVGIGLIGTWLLRRRQRA
jgi:hypothetical protein